MDATPMLDAALVYGERGWHVLPLRPAGKEPITPRGFKDATTDAATLTAWWRRYPNANIGIATGPSNLLVVDVDDYKPGGVDLAAWIDGRPWPETRTVRTGRGGRQYWFAQPASPGRSSVGVLHPYIDTRGTDGYVVAPPSVTEQPYRIERDLEVCELPRWVRTALDPPPVAAPAGWVTAYGSEALERECLALATTTEGRNDRLNRVAFRMGQLIASGHLDQRTVELRVTAAARRASRLGDHPLTDREIQRSFESGLNAGLASPSGRTPRATRPLAASPVEDAPRLVLQAKPLEGFTEPAPAFLWGNRLTAGGLTILAGDGGIGKSYLTTNLAIAFATGTGLPEQSPSDRGSSFIVSYEDPGAVILRRATQMGYDPRRAPYGRIEALFAPEAFRDDTGHPLPFTPADVDHLTDQLRRREDLRLVVIDPLMSFVGGGVDVNRDQQVRAVLHKLTALADDLHVAVVVVAHTVKGSLDPARALDAIAGSAGIKNLARSALIALEDSEDRRGYLFHRKHNWTARASALEYRFADGAFEWVGQADDDVLDRICERSTRSPLDRCVRWLTDELKQSTISAAWAYEDGERRGFSRATMRNAAAQLGVVRDKAPQFQGQWYWSLPEEMN